MFAVSESRCCRGARHLIHGVRRVCYICSPSRQVPTPWSPGRRLKRTCPGWPRQYYLLTWKTSIWYWPPAWTLRHLSQHTLCKSLLADPESAEGSGGRRAKPCRVRCEFGSCLVEMPTELDKADREMWPDWPQSWAACHLISLRRDTRAHALTHPHIQITSLKTVSHIHKAEAWIWTNIKPPFTHIFVVLFKQCPRPDIPDELFHTSIWFIAHVNLGKSP